VRILLDTHVLLWWLMEDPHLPRAFQAAIADAANDVFVSAVTHAEIAIKRSLGKLDAPWIPDELLAENGIIGMSFTSSHARRMLDLPFHHRDPFDRMLIAQAAHEDVAFATVDPRCRQYDIRLFEPA
jgi:PIN domain nuclease of toxin-antitoxin system